MYMNTICGTLGLMNDKADSLLGGNGCNGTESGLLGRELTPI